MPMWDQKSHNIWGVLQMGWVNTRSQHHCESWAPMAGHGVLRPCRRSRLTRCWSLPAALLHLLDRQALDLPNIITYDMGGTSTDACLIRNYEYNMTTEGHVGMWPNRAPQMKSRRSVQAVARSLISIPASFKRGPALCRRSSRSSLHGKGGTEPTVTDANVVLGRFRPDLALGGEIKLDEDAARAVSTLGDELALARAHSRRRHSPRSGQDDSDG